jgi:uncharacterized protein YceH (UPF0502 family)
VKQTDPQLKLRLPPELKAKIEIAAASARRPLSGEIIARLERTFSEDEQNAGRNLSFLATVKKARAHDVEQRISALEQEIEALRAQVRALETRFNVIKPG